MLNSTVELETINLGEDAVEFKIDAEVPKFLDVVSKHVALIRRRVGVPIIYKVEPASLRRSSELLTLYTELLSHGLRLGVEYIVVDIDSEPDMMRQLHLNKCHTRIIGEHHSTNLAPSQWLTDVRLAKYRKAEALGYDIVRLSQIAFAREDNEDIRIFYNRIASDSVRPLPLTCYNTGKLAGLL